MLRACQDIVLVVVEDSKSTTPPQMQRIQRIQRIGRNREIKKCICFMNLETLTRSLS